MKLCNEFPGFTRNLRTRPFGAADESIISVPRSHGVHPGDTMPEESYDDIRRLIAKLLPRFVGRDILDGKICWCTGTSVRPFVVRNCRFVAHRNAHPDTPDANWLMCEDPRWGNLYLASGDSG
jgi:hypothetical protein